MSYILKEGTISTYDPSMFSLAFSEEVRVKRIRMDSFSFLGSLNLLGSNLGLWPGLGLYQILEWMVSILVMSNLVKRIRRLIRRL